MLAELIMAKYGWGDVSGTSIGNPDNPAPGNGGRHRPLNAFKVRGFLVGMWTGPDHDLLCVKNCSTNEEAERYLSPPGRTILSATLRGLVVRVREDIATVLRVAADTAVDAPGRFGRVKSTPRDSDDAWKVCAAFSRWLPAAEREELEAWDSDGPEPLWLDERIREYHASDDEDPEPERTASLDAAMEKVARADDKLIADVIAEVVPVLKKLPPILRVDVMRTVTKEVGIPMFGALQSGSWQWMSCVELGDYAVTHVCFPFHCDEEWRCRIRGCRQSDVCTAADGLSHGRLQAPAASLEP